MIPAQLSNRVVGDERLSDYRSAIHSNDAIWRTCRRVTVLADVAIAAAFGYSLQNLDFALCERVSAHMVPSHRFGPV